MKSTRLTALTIILAALLALIAVVWAPPAHAATSCTVVWLDGDGQYGARRAASSYLIAGPDGIAAVAARHDCGLWVPLPPNGESTWWRRGAYNAAWLASRLPEGRLVIAGYSGGAQLITEYLTPGHTLPAGTRLLLVGGGDRPHVPVTSTTRPQDLFLRWVVGLADRDGGDGWDTLAAARRGLSWYAEDAYVTSADFQSGVDHDGYRFGRELDVLLSSQDPSLNPWPTPSPAIPSTVAPTAEPTREAPQRRRPHARQQQHHPHRWAARGPFACRPV